MTSEGLGEMFEDDFAEIGAEKFPLMSMGRTRDTADGERGPLLSFISISQQYKKLVLTVVSILISLFSMT